MVYAEKDGLKYWMEQKECSGKEGEFPRIPPLGYDNYTHCFFAIEKYMNDAIHIHVVTGAAGAGSGMLNDHGPGHISMVQERAAALLGEKVQELKGYELFILLLAIHFHDVGNIYGRDAHEEKIEEILDHLGDRLPLDSPVKRLVTEIAVAHGGNYNGDKDTLAYVSEREYIDGISIRAALLASLLRFADEMADDKTRTSALLLEMDAIPKENMAFHEYSRCLEPPVIEGDTVRLIYNILSSLVHNKVTKLNEDVFIYDEILSRIQKSLCELDYCKRYSEGFIRISALSIEINVISENGMKKLFHDSFRVRITGYPDKSNYNLISCSDSQPRATSGAKLLDLLGGEKHE